MNNHEFSDVRVVVGRECLEEFDWCGGVPSHGDPNRVVGVGSATAELVGDLGWSLGRPCAGILVIICGDPFARRP